MARIVPGGPRVGPALVLRDLQRAMAPTADFVRDLQRAMAPTADFVRYLQRAMAPTADFVRDLQRAMAPTADFVRDLQRDMLVDFVSAAQAVRELMLAAPSRVDILNTLKDLDDEIRARALAESSPGSLRWDRDQLQKLTIYMTALYVLVVAAVLQAYHPGVVEAVANVLAWPTAVFMLDQALRSRR